VIDIFIVVDLMGTGEFRLARKIQGTVPVPGYGDQLVGFESMADAVQAIVDQGLPDHTYIPINAKAFPPEEEENGV